MSYPLRRPDPPSTFNAQDHVNEVILYIHGGYHPEVPTKEYGIRPVSQGSVVLLSGRMAGSIFEDIMLYGPKSSQFRDWPGGDVSICRIMKKGNGTIFDPASNYDEQQANQWISANGSRLEKLRADSVKSYKERAVDIREQLGTGQLGLPKASPQFEPERQPELVNAGSPTLDSLRGKSPSDNEEMPAY